MFKQFIYIENEIATHFNTLKIIEKFKDASIIYIDHYKDVFNQSGSNWRLQKKSQKIILAKRKENFYYKGSNITPNFGYDNFYYNTLALNCVYDCDYCYLQGLFTSAHLVIFVNNEDFISETKKLILNKYEKFYFALSYDTDLLAIEHLLPFCKEWISFAAEIKNLVIEIRSKSANYKVLQNITPNNNVILAWTLSPTEIINKFEPQTPNLNLRINALKHLVDIGWRVRVCIDPILKVNKWQSEYEKLIEKINFDVGFEKLDSISLGVFRMNKVFLKNMQRNREDSSVLYYPYKLNNGNYSYSEDEKNDLINYVLNEIKKYNKKIPIEII